MAKEKNVAGVGLDIGTMNVVAARRSDKGVETKRMRDLFLDLPVSAKKMLKISDTSFVERARDVLILGDAALEVANVFGREPRRPLAAGLISSKETDSLEVLGLLIRAVLGEPVVENEPCVFSVPAQPIDADRDVIYHQKTFEGILRKLGYVPEASTEGMGIVFSECAEDKFSGLCLSMGSGMVNVALGINTLPGIVFSISRGGDWIDQRAAESVGSTKARMCALKEAGIDLTQPKDRNEQAIVFYYEALIDYALEQVATRFRAAGNQFALTRPIPLVVAGGTALAGGFMGVFERVLAKHREAGFPIEISGIRLAKDPLNAIAYGMLVQAQAQG